MRVAFNPHQPAARSAHERDLVRAQSRVTGLVDELYQRVPFLDGNLLEAVSLQAHEANDLPHKLARKIRGWMTMKRPALQCAFLATLSGAQSPADNTVTTVLFDSEVYDEGSDYNPATGIFTAPFDGLYRFDASAQFAGLADADEFLLRFFVNSTNYTGARFMNGGASGVGASSTLEIRLVAGDTVAVRVFQDNGTAAAEALSTGGVTRFAGRAIDTLGDGQDDDDHPGIEQILRLYSSCDRTVDLWVW